ncbi:MAG: rhomboid family intramembrane serine protease [Micrococcales bacterium]|nr:rhomboid family intramembrane serine protease [Micrococcales bacterium]
MTEPAISASCAFHPGRPAYVQCQRCDRRVCPNCQVPAAVGVQCPACVQAARQTTPAARSAFGAPLSQGLPLVTVGLIGLCGLLFLADQVTGHRLTINLGFVPIAARTEPWRVLTGALMHAGAMHLLLNMYCLWVVGSFLEKILGRSRYLVLLLVSALGGNLLVLAWAVKLNPSWDNLLTLTVGASGAVFGAFGAMLVLGRKLGRDLTGIAVIVGINLVLSFVIVSVSWQGHVGGLVVGSAIAAVYAFAPARQRRLWAWLGGAGAFLLLLIAWFLLTSSQLVW